MTTVCRIIAAPPEDVWEVLADPTTYPRWLVGAERIRSVDEEFPAPGAAFRHEVGAAPGLTLPDRTTAIGVRPGRSITLLVRARPVFEGRVRLEVAPHERGAIVHLREEPVGPLRVLAPLLAPLLAGRNAWSLARLAGVVEDVSARSSA